MSSRREPVRVLFYCDSDTVGGAEKSLGNLLTELSADIDATVVGTDESVVEWLASHRPEAGTVLLEPIRSKWRVGAIASHYRAFRRIRPDVLHVSLNSSGASAWAILCGTAVRGTRVVCVEQLPYPISHLQRRVLKRLASDRVAAYVAVGERSAGEVARFSGASPASIWTIYNGVPDPELEPLPRPSGGPVVGTLARLDRQKGLDVLLRALADLPGVTGVIVGEGPERESLIELADELGVSERVVLAGWSHAARRHLTAFDVFVLPSRFEGFPLSVVEAMLAGLPVVATDVGSIGEAVLEGETGYLVPPDDPDSLAATLRRLLADPERMRSMGALGRARARELFTADVMARRYEELYRRVVS